MAATAAVASRARARARVPVKRHHLQRHQEGAVEWGKVGSYRAGKFGIVRESWRRRENERKKSMPEGRQLHTSLSVLLIVSLTHCALLLNQSGRAQGETAVSQHLRAAEPHTAAA